MENKIKPYEIYTALKSPTSNIRCGLRDIPVNWKIKDYNEYNAFQR